MDSNPLDLLPDVPFVSVTPLYCLVTDEEKIKVTEGITITRFSESQLDLLSEYKNFTGHLRLYPPQCLLWEQNSTSFGNFVMLAKELSSISKDRLGELNEDDLVRSYGASWRSWFPP